MTKIYSSIELSSMQNWVMHLTTRELAQGLCTKKGEIFKFGCKGHWASTLSPILNPIPQEGWCKGSGRAPLCSEQVMVPKGLHPKEARSLRG